MGSLSSRNILHVTDAYAAGVMTAINELVKMQVANGNRVSIMFLTRKETIFEANSKDLFFNFKSFGKLKIINLIKLMFEVNKNSKEFDFIHFHSSRSGFFGRLCILNRKEISQIYTPHGYSFIRNDIPKWKQKIFYFLEATMARISRASIVSVSSWEYDLTQSLVSKKNYILYNSITVPSELFQTHRYDKPITKLKIAFVGRNTPAKDPEFFLSLAEKCISDLEFLWIGVAEKDVRELIVPSNVTLLGFQPRSEALQHISKADLLIVTSVWEGLPTNIIEAQMLGILVLMRDTLNFPELIVHGVTGLVFHDYADLKSQISQKNFRELAKNISTQAKRQADEFFSSSANNEKWSDVYSDIEKSISV